jgi:hypothetical protein
MSRYDWGKTNSQVDGLHRTIDGVRNAVIKHPVYGELRTLHDVNIFMEHHVFAVWDFMSLLKALQRELTCVDIPWTPKGSAESRRLINEIVLVEESDELNDTFISHFELYLEGMKHSGADNTAIMAFLDLISSGFDVREALAEAEAPPAAAEFVRTTWHIIKNAPVHCKAAAFAFGREDLIPQMFDQVIKVDDQGGRLATFRDYLARHIEVDGEVHTPMAMAMLAALCGDNQARWDDCGRTVSQALTARRQLWDGIVAAIDSGRPTVSSGVQ